MTESKRRGAGLRLKGDFSALHAVTRATGFCQAGTPGNGSTAVSARGFRGHGSTVKLHDGTRLYVGDGTVTFPADRGRSLDGIAIVAPC